MAKQTGLVKFGGTIDGISFYKTKDGYLARTKGGIDAKRMASDPAFQRTRENNSEFGNAGKSGKVLRSAFRSLLLHASDKRVTSRLTKEMVAIAKTDSSNMRGQRIVANGDLSLLQDFEFNANVSLNNLLFADLETVVDRTTGTIVTTVSAFDPVASLVVPEGTTHYKLNLGVAEVDFENESYVFGSAESYTLDAAAVVSSDIALSASVTEDSDKPIFQVLGIQFYQEVNGVYYPQSTAFNALSVIGIDTV